VTLFQESSSGCAGDCAFACFVERATGLWCTPVVHVGETSPHLGGVMPWV
jgi:hypothetical protein